MGKFIDLTGQKFGRLTVKERAENSKQNRARWKCICDCGREVIVEGQHLRSGVTKSCGCYQRECAAKANIKHGGSQTRLYTIWENIKKRCYNKNTEHYSDYGGRGISMCESWKNSFESFKDWALENGYSGNLTIDRIDFNGNYEPSNCRWVTIKEQANNKRNNILLTHNGETKTIAQWAEEVGLKRRTIRARIDQYGWTIEEALFTPVGQPRNKSQSI